MQPTKIQFTNGSTYERFMGRWSQLVGEDFLKWMKPMPGLRWLDVGCGNGAFTEWVVHHFRWGREAPSQIRGPRVLVDQRRRI